MNHRDHVNLLRPANLLPGGLWADFGAGTGAFTLALRKLVGPEAEIYALDRDRSRLGKLERAHRSRFGSHPQAERQLHLVHADFTQALDLPPFDGILMANSLHFYKDKERLLRHIRSFLKPEGLFLLVEYNADAGNPWVPHPLSFETFRSLALRAGYSRPQLLATIPSSFLRQFYSASARKHEMVGAD
jgi:ubiquinone/menaquinone biosynthesis C-methylase UbiE